LQLKQLFQCNGIVLVERKNQGLLVLRPVFEVAADDAPVTLLILGNGFGRGCANASDVEVAVRWSS